MFLHKKRPSKVHHLQLGLRSAIFPRVPTFFRCLVPSSCFPYGNNLKTLYIIYSTYNIYHFIYFKRYKMYIQNIKQYINIINKEIYNKYETNINLNHDSSSIYWWNHCQWQRFSYPNEIVQILTPFNNDSFQI